MTFIIFSIVAVIWSLAVLRWSFSIRGTRERTFAVIASWVALAGAAASIAADVRSASILRRARTSDLRVQITRRGDWWQLDYSGRRLSFTTANELHVPAGTRMNLTWSGVQPPPWFDHALWFDAGDRGSVLIAEAGVTKARFASFSSSRRELRVTAEPPELFDRWAKNEARNARPSNGPGPFLFGNSGCIYCHVIRGVSSSPSEVAPDLTHFGARRTIAGTSIPVGRASLSGWVVHSRGLKRTSEMPDNDLDPRTLQPLVDYLRSLR